MRVACSGSCPVDAECWTGVGLVLIQRRDGGPALRRQCVDVPCLYCVLCLPSEHEAPGWGDTRFDDGSSALTQLLVSCFLFVLLQSGNGILLGGAFV